MATTGRSRTPHLIHRGGLCRRGRRDRRQVSALALGLRRSCLHLLSCSRSGWEAAIRLLLCMMSQCTFTPTTLPQLLSKALQPVSVVIRAGVDHACSRMRQAVRAHCPVLAQPLG